jgi:hypothetical protein
MLTVLGTVQGSFLGIPEATGNATRERDCRPAAMPRTSACGIGWAPIEEAIFTVLHAPRGTSVTILASSANSDFAYFNPGALVAAVNALVTLGKDRALDAVEHQLTESDHLADPQHGLFLVLRLLFDVPTDPGFHLPMHIGIPNVAAPKDAKALPYFPLIVVDDIPLLLVTTFLLGGSPELVEAHLKHFREKGILRAAPLTPKTFLSPAEILDHLIPLYLNAYGIAPTPAQLRMLEQQLRRMHVSTDGKA